MKPSGRATWWAAAAVGIFLSAPASAQEHEPAPHHSGPDHERPAHAHHPNHFGGFLGSSFRLDDGESGGAFTLGLEYARQISPLWAVIGYTELVSSNLERDIIVAVGAVL